MLKTKSVEPSKVIRIERFKLFWDLDGTASDSFEQNFRATVKAARYFGLREPTRDELKRKFDPSGEFRKFHKSIGVPERLKGKVRGSAHTTYGKKWTELYLEIITQDPPRLVPGIESLIRRLSSMGSEQYVLTLAPRDNIEKQLCGIAPCFKDLMTVRGTKAEELANLRENMSGSSVVHIGDTVYDGKSSEKAGVVFGGLIHKYGYNTPEAIRRLIKQMKELAFAIEGVENFEMALAGVNVQLSE